MAVTPKFTPGKVSKTMQQAIEKLEKRLVERLQFVGETFIRDARNNHEYTDQTGNLTSSIGYVILKNGEQIYGSAFEVVKEGQQGHATGLKVVEQVASRFTKGYTLIVVAGMEYAAAVESMNKDVITASSITAANNLRRAFEKLGGKMK